LWYNKAMSREIPLSQGKVAIVDDEDYELVSRYKWHALYKHGRWEVHDTSAIGMGRSRMTESMCIDCRIFTYLIIHAN